MHELGIVFHIIKQIEDVAAENKVQHVNSVTLEIGTVSTVVPMYLIDVWKWAVERSDIMQGCKLKIENIDAVTYCENCKKTFSTIEYGKTCPYCLSEETYLITGDEVNIKEIEVI